MTSLCDNCSMLSQQCDMYLDVMENEGDEDILPQNVGDCNYYAPYR